MMLGLRRGALRTFVRLQSSTQRAAQAATNFVPATHSSPISSTRNTSTKRPPRRVSNVVSTLSKQVRTRNSTKALTDLVSVDQVRDRLEAICHHRSTDVGAVRRLLKTAQADRLDLESALEPRLLFAAKLLTSASTKKHLDRRGSAEIAKTAAKGDAQFEKCLALLETIHTVNAAAFPGTAVALHGASLPLLVSLALKTGNHYELYEWMLKHKMDVTLPPLRKIHYKLRKGTTRERELYEWSTLFQEKDLAAQKAEMMEFVMRNSADMIRHILLAHIKQGNQLQVSRYLELYIAKYAMDRKTMTNKFEIKKSTMKLYEMIGYVALRVWDYQSVLGVLETMKTNNVPLSRNFYTMLLTSMRKKKQFEAGLMLLRQLPTLFPNPDPMFQSVIANELISFVRSRFPNDARVVLAHFLAIYPNCSELVNRLGIPGVIYDKKVKSMRTFKDKVAVANLDEYFRFDSPPSNFTLSELYKSLFEHIQHHGENTSKNHVLLFDLYLKEYRKIPKDVHTDSVIFEQFIINAIQKARSPKTALYMLTEFLKYGPPKIWNKQIITYVFYHHGCEAGSEKFVKFTDLMAQYEVSPDFNLLAALSRKDKEQGELWYSRLKEMGYTVNLTSLKEKASALGWEKVNENTIESLDTRQEEEVPEEWEKDAEMWEDEEEGSEFVTKFENALKDADLWKR